MGLPGIPFNSMREVVAPHKIDKIPTGQMSNGLVKCFGHIKLEEQHWCFGFVEVINCALHELEVVLNTSTLNEGTLTW
jgi:hypothetical protein